MVATDSEQVDSILDEFKDHRASLIPILQEIQAKYFYLPKDALCRVSRKLRIPLTDVYQVATFYRCFSLVPRGKHQVQVCLGTACHVRGAPRVLDRVLTDLKLPEPGTTPDREFTVMTVRCIGCCGLAPVVKIDKNTHPHLTQAKVRGMLRKYSQKVAQPEPAAVAAGDHDDTAEIG
ncbi:MAG: NAD(P)H-dependent oxidoreductase subunit E [Acidobacteriaceae bacterium]|nr:NAD(P)H-dependent oxidoreductase subunit E [Acidobacteriaceae bacterium]